MVPDSHGEKSIDAALGLINVLHASHITMPQNEHQASQHTLASFDWKEGLDQMENWHFRQSGKESCDAVSCFPVLIRW